MINILWIDDRPDENFISSARREGLNIKGIKNVDDGIEEVLTSSTNYDALILDAFCLKHADEQPGEADINALGYALKEITANDIALPWFVYTTAGHEDENSIDVIVSAYEREYDDVNWYRKSGDMQLLFKKIKHVVHRSDYFILKDQYDDIVDKYANQDELIEIIGYLDESRKYDASVFNLIRKEMEFIFALCYEGGLLQQPYSELGLTATSKFLCQYQMEPMVSYPIQQLIRSVTRICNEGSHNLKIDSEVDSGRAPYLVRSTVMDFLNIVYWANEFIPRTAEEALSLRDKVKEALQKRRYYKKNTY